MNATPDVIAPAPLGAPFAGGYYSGMINAGGTLYALIVAPRDDGDLIDVIWHRNVKRMAEAMSFFDGVTNTAALLEAGSTLAKRIRALHINGHDDWYLPSRDELEMLYRTFKPTADENWAWRGDNPSSVPVGYAYMPDTPAQTRVDAFRPDGPEAFAEAAYWSSTQYAGNDAFAWAQLFGNGCQGGCHKSDKLRARAVRRLPL